MPFQLVGLPNIFSSYAPETYHLTALAGPIVGFRAGNPTPDFGTIEVGFYPPTWTQTRARKAFEAMVAATHVTPITLRPPAWASLYVRTLTPGQHSIDTEFYFAEHNGQWFYVKERALEEAYDVFGAIALIFEQQWQWQTKRSLGTF